MRGSLLDLYREPLFLWFPLATTAIGQAAFVLFAAPLTWLALRDPPSMRRHRIQARRPDPAKVLWPCARAWLQNGVIALALVTLGWPLMRLSRVHGGPLPPVWQIAAEVVLFVYLDDAGYYVLHRLMHVKWLYDRVHVVHHRYAAPWACTGNYLHPVEFIATVSLALLWPMAIGAHFVTVWVWMVFRQWEAAEGHSGYELPWNPSKLFPGHGGTAYHDFHHAKFRGNYAGFLAIWDYPFGTVSRGYREYRARGGAV